MNQMAKKKFTKLEQIGLIVMIGVAGMFFYLKLVYDPTFKKYTAYQKKHKGLYQSVDRLKQTELMARGSKDLKKRMKDKQQELQKAEGILVKSDSEAREIMTTILELAENNSLNIMDYHRPDAEALKEIIKSYIYKRRYYKIKVKGTYSTFLFLLNKINKLPQLVTIENVGISVMEGGQGGNLQMALLLSI